MGDDLLVCPYDPSHAIHPLRMPRHLLKCRKNHPTLDLAVCPFNAFHEVPRPELRHHMNHCPDKALLDRDIELDVYLKSSESDQRRRMKGFTELPKSSDHKLYGSNDELWEADRNENFSLYGESRRRNQTRSRRTNEEESSLRLPNREGMAARLANNFFASLENHNHHSSHSRHNCASSADEQSEDSSPRSSPQSSRTRFEDTNHFHKDLSVSQNSSLSKCSPKNSPVSHRARDSPSQARDSGQLTHSLDPGPISLKDNSRAQRTDSEQKGTNRGVLSLDAAKLTNTRSPASSLPHSRSLLKTETECASALQESGNSAVGVEPASSRREEDKQPAFQRKMFLLGRGRAMPSFNSREGSGPHKPGSGLGSGVPLVAQVTPTVAAAHSNSLSNLIHSLGRGRGLIRVPSTAVVE